jgi:hypothetical protein
MFTPMRTVLVSLEPLLVLKGMASVAAVLAPDDHSLIEAFLAEDTQQIALTVSLGD